jgi:hypothetical protein
MTGRSSRAVWLISAAACALILLTLPFLLPAQSARGKGAAPPVETPAVPGRQQAQALALADARVQAYLAGHRAEAMAVLPLGAQVTQDSLACALIPCRLVEIYDFDADATVSAIVDLQANLVRDVLYQPHVHPLPNQRLIDLAIGVARGSPEFIRELGRVPAADELSPMPSGVPGTPCDSGHICLAATAPQGRSLVWAVVDVTDGKLVAVLRTPTLAGENYQTASAPAQASECPAGGAVNRGGWNLSYETSSSDGFRVYDAAYLGVPVLTSAKIVEWHVDYGSTGFVDEMGCGSTLIVPHGATQVNDLLDGPDVVGFELVQDFRMFSWGSICNYRYEQHDQFYNDGRFRIVGEAFGQGCSTSGIYRPVMRIDLGPPGPAEDTFDVWSGAAWQPQSVEGWWSQAAPYTPQGYKWRLSNISGQAFFIEPGQGQFGDGGRGDFAYIYAAQHHEAEGDTDLGSIGSCCNDNEQQGPDLYLNGESIAGQDIVLWYVAQLQTEVGTGENYCWTVHGDPNPETYPCPAGPMFVPMALAAGFVDNAPQPVTAPVVFTSTSGGLGKLAYWWNFGDGVGWSSAAHPAYAFTAPGIYTVTLSITDTTGTQNASRTVAVGNAPVSGFEEALSTSVSKTVILTNASTGSAPISYQWTFGDGNTSTTESPSHTYAQSGLYTVVLTATNFITSNSISRQVVAPPILYYWPVISR